MSELVCALYFSESSLPVQYAYSYNKLQSPVLTKLYFIYYNAVVYSQQEYHIKFESFNENFLKFILT